MLSGHVCPSKSLSKLTHLTWTGRKVLKIPRFVSYWLRRLCHFCFCFFRKHGASASLEDNASLGEKSKEDCKGD